MFKILYNKAKEWLKKAAIIGTAVFALASSAKAQEPQQNTEQEAITYVVEEGDYLSNIAKNRLDNPSMEDIVRETNRIGQLNGKASMQEYPFQVEENGFYDCANAPEEDPNCIYPGDELILEHKVSQEEPIVTQQESIPANYDNDFFMYTLGLITGLAGGYVIGKKKEKDNGNEYLENLIGMKNDNKYASLDNLIEKSDNDLIRTKEDLKGAYNTFFEQYKRGMTPEGLIIERYDNNIAPEEMKMEMVKQYKDSEKSLDAVARDLSIKYGMNVSSSTISKYGRKELGVNSRKEAKEEVKKAA